MWCSFWEFEESWRAGRNISKTAERIEWCWQEKDGIKKYDNKAWNRKKAYLVVKVKPKGL